ncbi:MAG: hypothetical protein XD95_0225 [Microgenomates bacterium 39_7]|nr:MAG: hypothetical protein XD95_0225 [Microgenomates bacterium 39_7]
MPETTIAQEHENNAILKEIADFIDGLVQTLADEVSLLELPESEHQEEVVRTISKLISLAISEAQSTVFRERTIRETDRLIEGEDPGVHAIFNHPEFVLNLNYFGGIRRSEEGDDLRDQMSSMLGGSDHASRTQQIVSQSMNLGFVAADHNGLPLFQFWLVGTPNEKSLICNRVEYANRNTYVKDSFTLGKILTEENGAPYVIQQIRKQMEPLLDMRTPDEFDPRRGES